MVLCDSSLMFLNDWKVSSESGSAPEREEDVVHELNWGVTGNRILDISDEPVVFVEGADGAADGAEELAAELVDRIEVGTEDVEDIAVAMLVVDVTVTVERTLQRGRALARAGRSANARTRVLMRDIAMLKIRHGTRPAGTVKAMEIESEARETS